MDKFEINVNGTYGSADTDIKQIIIEGAGSNILNAVYVKFNNGTIERVVKPVDLDQNDFNQAVMNFLSKSGTKEANPGNDWLLLRRNNQAGINFDEMDSIYASQNKGKQKGLSPVAKGVIKGGIATAAIGGTLAGGYLLGKNSVPEVAPAAQTISTNHVAEETEDVVEPVEVELSGVSDEAAEYQSEYFDNLEAGVTKLNTYLHKFYHAPITDDEEKALKEIGIDIDQAKDYANQGFTAEEVFAALLRWGPELTNEQLASINHGEEIDIEKVMSSSKSESNNFEEKLIISLLIDDELDGVEEAIKEIFGEDAEEFTQFISMYKEYKKLIADEKFDEAQEKMSEIKVAYQNYAFGDSSENSRAFGLSVATWGTVFSVECQMNQFRAEVSYVFFDTRNGKEVEHKFKTNLWDEITARKSIEGFKNCSEVVVNGETKYAATIEGVPSHLVYVIDELGGTVDLALADEEAMMVSYNNFIKTLRMENFSMDEAFIGAGGDQNSSHINENSEYDRLVQGTLDTNPLLESINIKLENANIAPANTGYYNYVLNQKFMARKTKLEQAKGNGRGSSAWANAKPGDIIHTGETFAGEVMTGADLANGVMEDGRSAYEGAEDAKKAWEDSQEDGHDATDKDGNHDPNKEKKIDEEEQEEAEEEMANLQDIYAAAFNYALGPEYSQYYLGTSLSYDSSWLSSDKPGVAASASAGLEDGALARQTYSMCGEEVVNSSSTESPVVEEEVVGSETPEVSDEAVEDAVNTIDDLDSIIDQILEEETQAEEEQALVLTK